MRLKIKINKLYVFVILYVTIILAELFLCVPYERIEIFRSSQNVPHTEITGSGYETISDISSAYVIMGKSDFNATGKRVNTSQLLINLVFTTVVFTAIYFMFLYKKKDVKPKYKQLSLLPIEPPTIDFNGLAFADEATQQKAVAKYTADMFEYAQYRLEYESEDLL